MAKIIKQQTRGDVPSFNQGKELHPASLAFLHRRGYARAQNLVHLRFDRTALDHPMLEEFILMHCHTLLPRPSTP